MKQFPHSFTEPVTKPYCRNKVWFFWYNYNFFFGLKRNNFLAVHTGYFHTPISWEIIFDFFVSTLLNEPKYDLLGVGGVEMSDSCLFLYTGR
jgi:hypothetical protein